MPNRFRTVGLAAITLLGAFHLQTAEAAEGSTSSANTCSSYATGYAAGYCAAMGHDGWSSVTYTCNPDGTATIVQVVCTETRPRESEPLT